MSTEELMKQKLRAAGPQWQATGFREAVLVDSTGKIVGSVSKAIGTGFHAQAGVSHLGIYISEEDAKRAVEAVA